MFFSSNNILRAVAISLFFVTAHSAPATAQLAGNQLVNQALVKAGKSSKGLKAFYKANNYKPIWVGNKNNGRRQALLSALKTSDNHGLPKSRYNIQKLRKAFQEARRDNGFGETEILASKVYLQYAHDMTSGAINPNRLSKDFSLKRPLRGDENLLASMAKSSPAAFLKSLAPKTSEYQSLMAEKRKLERQLGGANGGQLLPSRTLSKGSSGNSVVVLRQKLKARGYGNLGNAPIFDDTLRTAVIAYQKASGLGPDGVVGRGTIARLNQGPKQKLIKVLVNLERERWMNFPRGKRHVYVNLAAFTAYIIDNGRASFETRVVVGKLGNDYRTPEFYDEMTHMVVNPTWHVPRSIAGKEYLPIIRRDPGFLARRNMKMVSKSGKVVNPHNVDLSQFNAKNFPYYIKQRPSKGNALGRVKFIFPNKFNIYLHDTPSKSLFNKNVRAFSHGCVRVQKPFELAYKLLERQTSNPKGAFHTWLDTGKEQYVNLADPVPVYLTYRTAYFGNKKSPSFYPDIYGRDKLVFNAMVKAGVTLRAVKG